VKATKPVQMVLRQALKREWRHLATERIKDDEPKIPLGAKFWPLSRAENAEVRRVIKSEETRAIVTCRQGRKDDSEIEVADAAYWVKGCSSLGRLRFAVLLRVGEKDLPYRHERGSEGGRTHATAKCQNDALRVVQGAREPSPFLGGRMLAISTLHRRGGYAYFHRAG
jgi:uncharacterized protein (DUF2252 family)